METELKFNSLLVTPSIILATDYLCLVFNREINNVVIVCQQFPSSIFLTRHAFVLSVTNKKNLGFKMSAFLVVVSFFIVTVALLVFLLAVQALLFWKKMKSIPRKTPRRGTVILHQMPPNSRVLNVSPSCVKLETYLRMRKIPYESEYSFNVSSKGKVPWIEYNGKAVADSNFVIRFLNEEFKVDSDRHLSAEQKAIARSVLVTLEENTYW